MAQDSAQEFGKLRTLLWPIHSYELKKLLPMWLMMLCISFNYTILRDTKDTLIVTASGSGAEAIPFLKVWCVVPSAIIFMLIFSKLSNILSKERLFYTSLAPFLVFFALFAMVLYPNRDMLHPQASADALQAMLPAGFKGVIAIYRNWTYSLFFILAELWGSVALSLLFWGFANEITRVSEAKRFYHLFTLGANVALLFSGPAIVYVSNVRSSLPAGVDAWGYSLNLLMGMVVVSGAVLLYTYRWMQKNVLTDPRFFDPKEVKKKKAKTKMSLGESFAFLAKSKYILCLALIVIGYGMAINLIEVTWKNQLKMQFPNPNEYSAFMGKFSFVTGATTIVMLLVVYRWAIMRGWSFAAILTPLVLSVTGMAFFAVVLFNQSLTGVIAMLGTTPLMLGVVIGAIQNILSKSTKYSLFDPTKEMAYIPLDEESKVKGKAAIDVVGARLGKSGGSLVQQALILTLGSIGAMTPYVAAIMAAVVVLWLLAVKSLGGQFAALTKKRKEEAAAAEPAIATGTAQPAAT